MRRTVLLGALLIGGWLVAPGCDPGPSGGDGGSDGGSDAGTNPDGGSPDGGQDGGVPSCLGFTAPTVSLQIAGTCPAFTACGGNPAGRWVYDGGCANNPFTNVTIVCTGATISGSTGTISGCVSFSGALSGTVERQVAWTLTASANFPSLCAPTGCAALETAVRAYYPGASCATVTGGCSCAISTSGSVNDSTAYVVTGTDIIAGGVPYPFCVSAGDVIQYREGGSSPQLPQGDLSRR